MWVNLSRADGSATSAALQLDVCFKAHKVKRDTRDHDIRKISGERSPEFRRDPDATSRNDGGSQ